MKIDFKQKSDLMMIILGVVMIVFLIVVIKDIVDKDDEVEVKRSEVEISIPDAEISEINSSKSGAYARNDGSRNVDRHWDNLASEDDLDSILSSNDSSTDDQSSARNHNSQPKGQYTVDDLLGDADQESKPKASGPGHSQRSTQRKQSKEEIIADAQRRREKAVADALKESGVEQADEEQDDAPSQSVSNVSIGEDATLKKSSIISSLDENSSGVSSLGDDDFDMSAIGDDYPFQCMFVRQAKLRNGDRVAVRLLEDMVVGGLLVPKNTHLQAICSIKERLCLEVSSIEMKGKIYRLGYDAYDNDGRLGIYCPDLVMSQEMKSAKQSGLRIFNSLIGGRVGSLAKDVVSTGVSVARSVGGDVAVTVPAGYSFFLVKKEKR